MNRRKKTFVFYLASLLCLSACTKQEEIYFHTAETEQLSESTVQEDTRELCYVYICGAVEQPGLYVLEEGARIFDVINKAGGLLEEADCCAVNQAELIVDGQMIYIYTKEEMEQKTLLEIEDGRVDLNKADVDALMTIPGIGESKAKAILSYREKIGGFSDVEELKQISGIKNGIFEQIKDYIKVSN